LALTTILDSGLPGNSHSGAISSRRPGVPAYLEQVLYASAADPESPGAYRYDPDSADPAIRDSDPRSPRYEPPHLRHRPGDTWIIDRERPHDPLDPGPYGSPGWYADTRTGRHRRGELPDPPREGKPTSPTDRRSPGPTPEGAEKPRPTPGRSGDEPPQPPRRSRFWREEDDDHRYTFGKLREDAWTYFLVDSQVLHQAHLTQTVTVMDRWMRFWERLCRLLFRVFCMRSTSNAAALRNAPSTAAEGPAEVVPPIRVEWQRAERTARSKQQETVIGVAKVKRPSPLAGTPAQGVHHADRNNPFIAQWERHFDAAQAFREVVVL
jgi:hypothetical protein